MTLSEELFAGLPGGPLFGLVVGGVLVLFGRHLFWLLLAAVGFLLGLGLGMAFLEPEPGWIAVGVGVVAGLVGAVLAVVVQKVAVGVAGFALGGYAAWWLVEHFGWAPGTGLEEAVVFAVGGAVAAVVAVALFGWALIAVSAVGGAVLVAASLELAPWTALLVVFGLAVLGIAVQAQTKLRRPGRG